MSKQTTKLSARDKKILVWGLNELNKFAAKGDGSRLEQAGDLKKKWRDLGGEIADCQKKLQELQQKWKDKVDHAKCMASWCNWVGGLLAIGGIVGGVVAVMASAPVWVTGAAVGVAVVGITTVVAGQLNLKAHKGIQNKIENMQKYMTSYEDHVQKWVEAIETLEIPLWGIGLGPTDDYDPVIDEWTKIADHEKDLLKTAAVTFRKFKENSLNSLNAIRKIQRDVKI